MEMSPIYASVYFMSDFSAQKYDKLRSESVWDFTIF